MAASGHRLLQVLSVFRDHPRMSCLLLLLFTPPFYPVVAFFTPLLFSTALCVFAFFSLSPYFRATDAEVERQSTLGTSGEMSERSRSLDCSRQGTTSDVDVAWFESWIRGLNEAGRTWMEPLLSQQANKQTVLSSVEDSFFKLATTNASIQSGADYCNVGLEMSETPTVLSFLKGTALKGSQVGKIVQDDSNGSAEACFEQGETRSNGLSRFHGSGHTEQTSARLKEEAADAGKSTCQLGGEESSRSGLGRWDKDKSFLEETIQESTETQWADESTESEQLDASKVSSLKGPSTGKELERFSSAGSTGQEWCTIRGTQLEADEGPRFDEDNEGPRFDEDQTTVVNTARQGLDALEREIEEAVAKLEELPIYEKVSSRKGKCLSSSASFRERER